MKKIMFLIFLLVILSCESDKVLFETPQPDNVKNIDFFTKDYIGLYSFDTENGLFISLDEDLDFFNKSFLIPLGENHLRINSKAIMTYYIGNEKTLQQLKDSSVIETTHKGYIDTLISELFNKPNVKYEFNIINNDTLISSLTITDTLFKISSSNCKLRLFKNKLYLNIYSDSTGFWSVYQMHLNSDNKLWINSVSSTDEVILKRLMELNNEKIGKKALNPSKKTFKKFLKLNGFENSRNFEKID